MEKSPSDSKFSPAVRVLILLCAAMVGFLAVSVISYLLFKDDVVNHIKTVTFLQDVFVFIAPAIAAMALCFRRPLHRMGLLAAPSWRAIAVVVAVWAVSLPAMNWIVEWNKSVSFPAAFAALEQMMRQMEDAAAAMTERILDIHTVGQLLSTLFVVAFMAGLSEEIFFRGAMQQMLCEGSRHRVTMVWVVALIFSAIHFQFFGFVPRLLLGAWLGFLLLWSRSLWVPIIAHTLNNATVVVASYLGNIGLIDAAQVDRIGLPDDGGFPVTALLSAVLTVALIWGSCKFFQKNAEKLTADEK